MIRDQNKLCCLNYDIHLDKLPYTIFVTERNFKINIIGHSGYFEKTVGQNK